MPLRGHKHRTGRFRPLTNPICFCGFCQQPQAPHWALSFDLESAEYVRQGSGSPGACRTSRGRGRQSRRLPDEQGKDTGGGRVLDENPQ